MTAWRKLNFGAIPATDAPTITHSGTYALAPLEQSSGVRMLRIPNGIGQFFDLDFRQRIGLFDSSYDPSSPAVNGVAIHIDDAAFGLGHPSRLLDTTPETASCTVPNLKRKKLRSAKQAIRRARCRLGKVKRRRSKGLPSGRVISQKPTAGRKLALGARVNLVVSSRQKRR